MAGNPVQREVVEAFYAAYAVRDAARVAEFLDDNVVWTISGPVDVLPFCGTRHGKAAVLDLIERRVPEVFSVFSFVPDTMLIEGDRVATLNRLSARRADDGCGISYRLAHFIRFRDNKIVSTLSLIDSYDAVEQVLGHSLAGPAGMPEHGKNVVAV